MRTNILFFYRNLCLLSYANPQPTVPKRTLPMVSKASPDNSTALYSPVACGWASNECVPLPRALYNIYSH